VKRSRGLEQGRRKGEGEWYRRGDGERKRWDRRIMDPCRAEEGGGAWEEDG
jgi:hypothetical protein